MRVERRRDRESVGRLCASTHLLAVVLEAHVARHADHPRVHRAALPSIKPRNHAKQCLLGNVVGVFETREVHTEPPDVRLNRANEPIQRKAIAALGCKCDAVELQHAVILAHWGTFHPARDTCIDVNCVQARETLSAYLDQEATPEEISLSTEHLGGCPDCRAWWEAVGKATRVLRVRVAQPSPDIATPVLVRGHPPRVGRGQWIRISLAAVALLELVHALPGLVLGHGAESIHDARHLGSFGIAVSIGLLYVAWRPVRAYGILPIAAALAITMGVSALIDIVQGRATSLGEAHHLLDISGLILVWMLAGRPAPKRLKSLVDHSRAHRLRHT